MHINVRVADAVSMQDIVEASERMLDSPPSVAILGQVDNTPEYEDICQMFAGKKRSRFNFFR